MTTLHSYTLNQEPVSHAAFVGCALNPAHSVTVEACAGSGKTWLLVGRMLRILLAGAAPGSILAITFTRKAAQEMQARLHTLLHDLAVKDDATALKLLQERGLSATEAQQQLGAARLLYEQVLTAQPPLKVETFHGWFWQVLRRAPWRLEAAARAVSEDPNTWGQALTPTPQATLLEQTESLEQEAWQGFLQRAAQLPGLQQAYLSVLQQMGGDKNARGLLRNLIQQRAEWWAFAYQHAQPVTAALALWPDFDEQDPRADWCTSVVLHHCQTIVHSVPDNAITSNTVRDLQTACVKTLAWAALKKVDGSPADERLEKYAVLRAEVLTQDGRIPKNLLTDKQLKNMGGAQTEYEQALQGLAAHFQALEGHYLDWQAWQLNRAAWPCALAWLEEYQQRKAQQQAIDFADIEWHTRQLLQDERYCAYMQMRLDARYQHLLFDEFQDTNPFQWGIVQAWLAGYGADAQRPSVFVVGDPKQSIYRFRRADPRLFATARTWLQQHFAAQSLRTNHTWRNAQAVIDVVNQVFEGLPENERPQDFVAQTTELIDVSSEVAGAVPTLSGLSGVYCHPLIPETGTAEEETEPSSAASLSLRNPFETAYTVAEDIRRREEAEAMVRLIQQTLPQLRVPVGAHTAHHPSGLRAGTYGDVMILVRTRTHLFEYEKALQAAGIPFVSDRRGGLLDTPEANDIQAVLRFLSDTHDDLALAHCLATPIFAPALSAAFGSVEHAFNQLALKQKQNGGTWWQALQALQTTQAVWQHIAEQLADWHAHAGRWPVHDVLDRLYHQGQVLAAYTACTPALRLAQVQANLRALLALALNLDGGRYASLPRFLEELTNLKRASAQESPDEASLSVAQIGEGRHGLGGVGDVVRLLTVHAAKGLEAPLVLLPDASYQPTARGNCLLFDWPPEQAAPTQVSFVGQAKSLGPTRAALWESEQQLAQREAQNLLYVALTRAKHLVLVTGVERKTKGGEKGGENSAAKNNPIVDASKQTWYSQLNAVSLSTTELPKLLEGALPLPEGEGRGEGESVTRSVDELSVPVWSSGAAARAPVLNQSTPNELMVNENSPSQQLGTAWHGVLQRIRYASQAAHVVSAILPRFDLPPSLAVQVQAAVEAVLHAPALQAFFSSDALRIETELDVLTASGELKRIDRLVELADAVWILDYKWQITPAQQSDYQAQVKLYTEVLREVLSGMACHKPIRMGLITAQGKFYPIETEVPPISS